MQLALPLRCRRSGPTLRRRLRQGHALGTFALVIALASPPASGNPPPPSAFDLPEVQPIRVTAGYDISGGKRGKNCFLPGDACFEMMFEVLNWTNQDVFGVLLVLNDADYEPGPGPPPTFLTGFGANRVKTDGRPLFGTGDDANFPPADGTTGTKTGAPNNFTVGSESTTAVLFTLDSMTFTGIPPRDLLGAADSAAACDLVPGCQNPGLTVANAEEIDNGATGTDGGVDNVLDGFVVTFEDFFFDEVASINFYLLDAQGFPIGYDDGTQILGNGFGFGVINVFQVDGYAPDRSHGPPVWTRQTRGSQRGGTETGNTGTLDPPANLRDIFATDAPPMPTVSDDANLVFQVEVGSALTGRFRDTNDSPATPPGQPNADHNGETFVQFPVELMSFRVED